MARTRTDDREPEGRKRRIPLGAPTQRLAAHEREGFHPRWINDEPGRLTRAEEAGYEFVTTSDERQEKRREIVGRNTDGSAKYAYLMEIPQEYYDEDQRAKLKPVDEFERAVKSGKPNDGASITGDDGDKFYSPRGSGGSRIKHE